MRSEATYDQYPRDRDYGPTVLIVDDDTLARGRLKLALSQLSEDSEIHLLEASSLGEAHQILSGTLVHVLLLDKNLGPVEEDPGQNGIEAIPELIQLQPQIQILMVTGSNDVQDVVRAMQFGASGYVPKELPDDLIVSHIKRAIQLATLKLEKNRRNRIESALEDEGELGGSSRIFTEILFQSDLLAESDRPILITGETGTGKTAIVRRIHAKRERFLKQKDRPLFSVNVSTLAHELIESELFGHERGAFTDAKEMKQGLFELANNGTLFFDEIGELPLNLQPKLLTVIEEGTFMRVGGKRQLSAKPKLIFATNRDLEKMVADGLFREDLYMRISMFTLKMPSLSEHIEDIPDIIRALLPRSCRDNHVQVCFEEIPLDFIEHLKTGPLQGNIRSVQNQLDRLLVYSPRDSRGHPRLSKWRAVPGLYVPRRSVRRKDTSNLLQTPISYREMMTRPWDFFGPEFPGFSSFMDEVKVRLLENAKPRLGSNRNIAKVFGMSESNISMIFNRKTKMGQKSKIKPASCLKEEL